MILLSLDNYPYYQLPTTSVNNIRWSFCDGKVIFVLIPSSLKLEIIRNKPSTLLKIGYLFRMQKVSAFSALKTEYLFCMRKVSAFCAKQISVLIIKIVLLGISILLGLGLPTQLNSMNLQPPLHHHNASDYISSGMYVFHKYQIYSLSINFLFLKIYIKFHLSL